MDIEYTPSAPHYEGVRGLLIQTAAIILGSKRLTDMSFTTTLVETEGILISRPITKLSVDFNDNKPLSPNLFLLRETSKGIRTRPD